LIYLKFKKIIYAEYIASDYDKFVLGVNQALFWTAIKQGVSKGYEFFDFGKSLKKNIGLLNFKRHWGAVENEAPTFYYPSSKSISLTKQERYSYKLMSYLYKIMPEPLLRWSSRFLYKHMG
jgi:lipid II:glycine glycyltransferase (peptidoglycan interpeptide bridge formation enzyme)